MVLGLIFGIFYLFSDIVYWAKYAASILALRLRKRIHHRRFDLYDPENSTDPEKLAILVPKAETILESPFPEEHLEHAADEIFFYGVNSKSQSLVVRITRSPNDESEAWLYLKLKDGRWYELKETSGYQRNFGGKCTSFSCGGLQLYYLSPMRRWRITFCGMLQEGKISKENEKRKEVFVKFTFIWRASSDVFDPTYDLDVKATADSMANAKWSSPIPPADKIAETLNFYCQSGVIDGVVSIEDQLDEEMYLYGERVRYLGKSSYAEGCKYKHILGVSPESGLIVHLGRESVPNTFHNLYFGFVVHPNSAVHAIEDGIIISRMSVNEKSGKNLTAMFNAGKKYELNGDFIGDGVRFESEQGWNGHLELIGIEFEVNGVKGSGFMISGEVSKLPERKSKKIPFNPLNARARIVYFTDDACQLTDLTGGKGSSLGTLTKFKEERKTEFMVPKGIVVTTAAYNEFLTSEIIEKINNLKDIAYGNIKGSIQEACQIVSTTIERAYLPDKITKEIEEKLRKLFGDNINHQKVAVRSSATGEDTDQMSAAGQMETFLGVKGLKQIFRSVKMCWASQFHYIAVEYKRGRAHAVTTRQNGQILNSPMAVVIQEMVECEASGVLFTCDPVTNNPSVTVITGNYGLGESVVSGAEEPDTVVLKKMSKNDVAIESVSIGLKQRKIVMKTENTSENEGVTVEDVPDDKRNECCISPEMAVKLGKLALKIEDNFKSPRDIEWGIKDNIIYILQSRPVTAGAAASDYEIKHEFDGPLRCEKEFFSVCNVGEVMPGATSPLGLDVIAKYFNLVFQRKDMKKRQQNNFCQSIYYPSGLLPFYNHMMMTVIDLITRLGDNTSLLAQSTMVGVFGRILDMPEIDVLSKYKEVEEMKKTILFYINLIQNLFLSGYGMEKLKDETFAYQVPAVNGKTSKEIFDIHVHSANHFLPPALNHMVCSEMSSVWNMYLFATLGSAKGSIDTDVYSDFAKLLSSSSNVESADVPAAIQELAQGIAKEIKGEDFKAMSVEEALKWLETSTNLAGVKYRQFIKRHGHRCLKEFDVYSIPWRTDPRPLIKLLQSISGSCEDAKEKKEDGISEILPNLVVPLNWKTKLLLRFLLPHCRRGVRYREAGKSILIKAMDNIRKGFRHLSKTMVAEGYLPDSDLAFFMTIDEINDLLQTRNPRLITRANQRRKLFPSLETLLFPEICEGRPVPMNESQEDEVEYVADLTMKGIPVSQGSVKGYARVAISLEEAAHLKRGEILITYSTDIGWSPYFPIIAGVVTELGGLISHGAVVSREYGLPCVVGLHGATRQFVTGDYVLLDGNKGILQRLTPPEN